MGEVFIDPVTDFIQGRLGEQDAAALRADEAGMALQGGVFQISGG